VRVIIYSMLFHRKQRICLDLRQVNHQETPRCTGTVKQNPSGSDRGELCEAIVIQTSKLWGEIYHQYGKFGLDQNDGRPNLGAPIRLNAI
jgi:hypothetical protein